MNNREMITEESEATIDLSVIINNALKGFIRFGWIILLLAVLASGITCLRMQQSYQAYYTAQITFAVNLNEKSNGTMFDDNLRANQMSATFPYIITSDVLRNFIAADLGVNTVSEKITAENVESTNLFTLKVRSDNARRAYDVLQSVIKNYPKVAENVVGETHLSMIEESGIPKAPDNPLDYLSGIKIGALFGVGLGFIIIILYSLTRKTVYKAEDFAELSSIKLLGSLPQINQKARKKNHIEITIKNNNYPEYRENIYRIRTRLEKAVSGKNMKSILITSAIPAEGKSTVAYNLALALAEEGRKVILVDCDLYHPSIKKMLPNSDEIKGFEKVFEGELELEEAISYFEDIKLSVLAGADPIDNYSEIIDPDKINEILAELEKQYDYIILDTPPSAILSGTSDIAKCADGAIYVVKQDYAKVKHVIEGLEHLSESSNVEIIGFVFNCSKEGFGGYGYGYGYGRYGHYGKNKKKQKEELIIEDT